MNKQCVWTQSNTWTDTLPQDPTFVFSRRREAILIVSKFAIWNFSAAERTFRLLAGSVEVDGAGVADGIGSEARFNVISGIVGTNDGRYAYVSDRYGRAIKRISVASGAVE